MSVGKALRQRRSSFGSLTPHSPVTLGALGTVLDVAAHTARFPCDALPSACPASLVKLYLFVNHVQGLAAGSYEFDAQTRRLHLIRGFEPGEFLQENCLLTNYSLAQAGVVLVIAARPGAVLDALGDRGYRLVNAIVGAVAQSCYLACAALTLGCGAILGFDNASYIEELGLTETDEVPLLILAMGSERVPLASFRYDIVPQSRVRTLSARETWTLPPRENGGSA